MKNTKYKPIAHDHAAMLEKALEKKGFRAAYDALEEEYDLLRVMLRARMDAGLTQSEVAEAMGTTKSAIARLESFSGHSPSFATLRKYAHAVGGKLEIRIVSSGTEKTYTAGKVKRKGRSSNTAG